MLFKLLVSPLPVNLGGYSFYPRRAWRRFVAAQMLRYQPAAYLLKLVKRDGSAAAENDCIFTSLQKLLLAQFGILLPDESVFEVFNLRGGGIPAAKLLLVISAVVEPVGVEIDRVLIINPDLSRLYGCDPRVVGANSGQSFDGQPGICMIHVEGDNSHAFFWDKMDARKFHKPQFRMAVLLRRKQLAPESLSFRRGLGRFGEMLSAYLSRHPDRAAAILPLSQEILAAACAGETILQGDERQRISSNLGEITSRISAISHGFRERRSLQNILETAAALRRILESANMLS